MSSSGTGLIVFAKVPERGKVKTRLEQRYTKDQTLQIYEAMLRDVLDLARSLTASIPHVSVYWTGQNAPPEYLVREYQCLSHHCQRGNDLGEKIHHAMQEEFLRGRRKVILIGCDSPTLPHSFFRDADALLDSADFVIGPTTDGGYYLIGASRVVRVPFTVIKWGTSDVLSQTLSFLKKHNLSVELLPRWYDLDRPEDLQNLPLHEAAPDVAKNLRAVFNKLPDD